jgi:hypothetical protein
VRRAGSDVGALPRRGATDIRRNNHRETGELIDPAALADELPEAAEVLTAVAQVAVDADHRLAADAAS